MDHIDTAAAACGGLAKLAEVMGESAQTVSNWRARGVPIQKCAQLERATAGIVTRRDLRPDDWHRIWPELVGTEGAPSIPTQEPSHADS